MVTTTTNINWLNHKHVFPEKATIHVLTHALHYGSSAFDGLRAYETSRGVVLLRLREHSRRRLDSAKIYRMSMPWCAEQLREPRQKVVSANGLDHCAYIRPLAFCGDGDIGVTPKNEPPTEMAAAAWECGQILGLESEAEDVNVGVSSWQRLASNPPARARFGRRQGSLEPADQRRGATPRLRQRHRARCGRHPGRGRGGDPVSGQGRRAHDSRACALGARQDHARHGQAIRQRTQTRLARVRSLARTPLYRRRLVLQRHGRRGSVTEAHQSAFFGLFSGHTRPTNGAGSRGAPRRPHAAACG